MVDSCLSVYSIFIIEYSLRLKHFTSTRKGGYRGEREAEKYEWEDFVLWRGLKLRFSCLESAWDNSHGHKASSLHCGEHGGSVNWIQSMYCRHLIPRSPPFCFIHTNLQHLRILAILHRRLKLFEKLRVFDGPACSSASNGAWKDWFELKNVINISMRCKTEVPGC